jgi:transcriptional regulator of acetoin/glycerol metabolism
MFESYLHWRAGIGFHGLSCLVGPVHRNAIPLLAALSLAAAALAEAADHLLAWARAVVRELLRRRLVPQRFARFAPISSLAPLLVAVQTRSRGPPLAA